MNFSQFSLFGGSKVLAELHRAHYLQASAPGFSTVQGTAWTTLWSGVQPVGDEGTRHVHSSSLLISCCCLIVYSVLT